MARNPKPIRKGHTLAERKAALRDHAEKVKQLVVGAKVKSCGGLGVILKREGPYRAPYFTFGVRLLEYDLLVDFGEDGGGISWHGLVDCSEIPK